MWLLIVLMAFHHLIVCIMYIGHSRQEAEDPHSSFCLLTAAPSIQQVMNHPTAPSPQAMGPTISAPTYTTHAEPSDAPCSYSHVPILTKDNYLKWQLSVTK